MGETDFCFHCATLFAAVCTEASFEGFVLFLLDGHDGLKCHLLLLVGEVCDILWGECVAAMQLLEFFANSDLSPPWIETGCLFETVVSHGKVGHGGPLLFVEEVIVSDCQEGYFVG